MKIVVNLDVMMARRKMSLSELAHGQSVHSEKQQGSGHPIFYSGGHLCRAGLSARGYSGICTG